MTPDAPPPELSVPSARPVEEVQPRTVQPWSDAGRAITERTSRRRTMRRKKLARFNDHLADMIVRDIEEERQISGLVGFVVAKARGALVLGGAVLLYRWQGPHKFSVVELALMLTVAVTIGVSINPLWRIFRGEDHDDEPDPFAERQPDPHEPDIARLGLLREREYDSDA